MIKKAIIKKAEKKERLQDVKMFRSSTIVPVLQECVEITWV